MPYPGPLAQTPEWSQPIAIVGMSCRVPGASSLSAFWTNLCSGVDSIRSFSDEELLAAGIPSALFQNPDYVKVSSTLDSYEGFDAAFFRCSPREAAHMDPQHRVFLETAWEALEDAGYDPFRYKGAIGIFGGAGGSISSYLFAERDRFARYLGGTAGMPHLGNDKDFLTSRVSYKLDLRGPAVTVQTACSTSLVAVHLACQSLRRGESDMALAGGVSIRVPHVSGYLAREGDIVSRDGVCRPFDAGANGTVFGSGSGIVVLKSLDRALADGDHIYALIRGSASNNDGSKKLSYTSTSVVGQESCIRAALAAAGVDRSSISYIEAHGTATFMGDPLEIDALNRVYGDGVNDRCGVGSVKGNVGHLEAAAGVIGLIKSALALHHEQIPPSPHFDKPNPRINFEAGPFYVVRALQPWLRGDAPRRAAVNSLGVGGTNAHVLLEEAPLVSHRIDGETESLLMLSAHRPEALIEVVQRLIDFIEENPQSSWIDLCYTAAQGRAIQEHRLVIRAPNATEATRQLNAWLKQPTSLPAASAGDSLEAAAAAFKTLGTVYTPTTNSSEQPPRRLSLPTYPFARDRYWIDEPASYTQGHVDTPIGLRASRRTSPLSRETSYESTFTSEELLVIAQHRIYDRVLVPGAWYLAMIPSLSTGQTGQLRQVDFLRPLALAEHTPSTLQFVLAPAENDDERFEGFSQSVRDRDTAAWLSHIRGLRATSLPTPSHFRPVIAFDEKRIDSAVLYERFCELGLDLGNLFRTVKWIERADGRLRAAIKFMPVLSNDHWIHPATLDGCLQLVVGNLASPADGLAALFLPLSIERFAWFRRPESDFVCDVRMRPRADLLNPTLTADLVLHDERGTLVELDGLVVKLATRSTLLRMIRPNLDEWLHKITWRGVDIQNGEPIINRRNWLVVNPSGNDADGLAELFHAHSHTFLVAGPTDRRGWLSLLSAMDQPLDGVVMLATVEASSDSPMDEQASRLGVLLTLVQALVDHGGPGMPRLWVVTRGARDVQHDELPLALSAAPMWGFVRTLAHEQPGLRGTCVDLDPRPHEDEWSLLFDNLVANDDETQIAYRGRKRYVARLQKRSKNLEQPISSSREGHFKLDITNRGSLDNLCIEPLEVTPPSADQVQLNVEVAGLNFRDVLNALDQYPGEAGPLGMECAGVVSEVGADVVGLKRGDRVVALAQGSLASTVTVSSDLVALRPDNLTATEAAVIPVVFVTAELALNGLAMLRRGERILIHAAAGGVGCAAVQIARQVGAVVFASASRDKWGYLRRLGVSHLYDSRMPNFAAQLLADTDGNGCDVVLNSLTGEFIAESLAVMAKGGRFVELGKRGIWTADQVRNVRSDIEYHVLALDHLMASSSSIAGQVLKGVLAKLAARQFSVPPTATFPIANATDAFRRLQQAKHVGKIALSLRAPQTFTVSLDASYLIVGGLGGLGLIICQWLIERGARALAILHHSDVSSDQLKHIAWMEAKGASVQLFQGNVADKSCLSSVFEAIRVGMPPLKGVFHLAGTLNDGLVGQQHWSRVQTVISPKVAGAWNLHQLTRTMSLDTFVLFSSSTSWLGAAGQSSYAAANDFLDTLAAERAREGLPAISICWGPWSDTGMAARLGDTYRRRWHDQGFQLIDPRFGVELLERVLDESITSIGLFRIDWTRYQTLLHDGSFLADVNAEKSALLMQPQDGLPVDVTSFDLIKKLLLKRIRTVLGCPDNLELDPNCDLEYLGLDSLMAVELLNQLRIDFRPILALPPTLLFDYPSVDQLVEFIRSYSVRSEKRST